MKNFCPEDQTAVKLCKIQNDCGWVVGGGSRVGGWGVGGWGGGLRTWILRLHAVSPVRCAHCDS